MSMLLALAAFGQPVAAADSSAVMAALTSADGWESMGMQKGVDVYTKPMPGLDVPAFKGTRTVPVGCDAYFVNVADPAVHSKVNTILEESAVIKQEGDSSVFYQVLDSPWPASDRYWIVRGTNFRDIDGVKGHHRQTWQVLPTGYDAVRKAVVDKYDAVFTQVNYGQWELVPAGAGKCTITYSVVSHPGGSVPDGAAAWGSGKTLPANIKAFEDAAK